MNTENPDIPETFRPDAHYQHLMNVIPPWLRQSTPQRREALGNIKPGLPTRIRDASKDQHAELGRLITRQTTSQNRVDQALANLLNPAAFAEPLLKGALKTRFGLEVDVSKTFLRLYIPAHIPWLRLKSGAARTWTVSLLDAALHNFESAETEADAFEPASTYITAPSSAGLFSTLPQILAKMPIAAFTRLCRELDIGERYKRYLDDNLGISNPVVAAILQPKIRESQKTALTAALQMAQMQNLLASDIHQPLLRLLSDARGQSWRCHELTIMNARLTGIVLFAPELERAREAVRVVAYIPDDPEHPIKQYPSTAAFAEELSQRLRAPDYQRFFSRFINHEDRGYFFAELNNRLDPITWQPLPPGDPRPTWRENPNQRPDLQMAVTPIRGDLWVHLYQRKLDKILNDARVIAVSTATVDRKARWALWDSFTEIASALLNIAAFIALPFVPFLGELMLAYTAYQLLDETFEGVVDWAEGLTSEAFEHFMGMVESAVQLGTFAAGGTIAASEFRAVLPRKVVQFFDRFNAVKRPNGETRYWKPDLTAYEQTVAIAKDAKPDSMGLHAHQGKTLLTLDDNHYSVVEDPLTGRHRIQHPTRPEAYQPTLRHNGKGAWHTELEQPLTWDQATLLRRLGPDMQRFSESERERILTISGCHENALRKMHVDAEQIPPLLADTLKRFKIDQDLQIFIDQIGSNRADDYRKADPLMQLELLCDYGSWPADKGLRLIDATGETLWERGIGNRVVVQINRAQLDNGDLITPLLQHLDRTDASSVRRYLTTLAADKRETLFSQRYRKIEQGARPLVQRIIDSEPGLPTSLAEALLDSASAAEREQLERGTLSKRLTELAQEAGLQVRVTRAYEGLYLYSTRNHLDTDRLALHTLERLPGWSGQLRLEIRQYTHNGPLIDSIGEPDAPLRKVLVLTDEGAYQAYDDAGEQLSSTDTLYSSLLQALPDSERIALNINIGEGERLKRLIRTHAVTREALRALLAQRPNLKTAYDPAVMRLLGGGDGYRRMPANTPSLQSHIHRLFPHLSAEELEAFAVRLQGNPGGARAELQRLFYQHAQLFDQLSTWLDEIPLYVPGTQTRLSVEQFASQRHARRQMVARLLDCWRRQATYDSAHGEPVSFEFSQPVFGELPRLSVDFPQVRSVTLEGHRATRGVNEFLKKFSSLNRLALRNFELGELPDAIAQWPQLDALILSDCAVTLTDQSRATLSALNQLSALDLYKNPLGVCPSLQNMPNLNYVDLSSTELSELPPGLLTRPRLRTALFNDNRIEELSPELFKLPGKTQEGFDLGGNPICAADRERIKVHFNQTGRDFGVFAEQVDIQRLQQLYPRLDQEEASAFIYRLPGTLAEGRIKLTRLETEYDTLRNELAAWTADIPPLHPVSGEPFTPQQLLIEHATRDEFKQLIERCWRRETDLDDFNQDMAPSYQLTLTTIVTGDLPALSADFSHVTLLYLHSDSGLTSGAGRFLERFPKLMSLTIQEYNLGEIPEAVFRMGRLTALSLSECQITLTAQSVLELAQLEHLDYLDLSVNPLGLTPDLSQMPDIATLKLNDTGITELPAGLLQLRSLDIADLSANAITRIPRDILELPLEIAESINLRGNPLDEQSLQTLIAYFKKTSTDFGVEAVIERAELEMSTSEDSEPDE
ncbi:dermonecrotic toxin domain-containing protein [Pseudomonas laurylsulfatiphila]|uniref:dermonecrotic toxin domain-containing protein n=1 Tax=Pseudomonas laurylsulfatiphila TaxID=2011015 RepID=UPI003D261CBA